jgi:hypothetical protein
MRRSILTASLCLLALIAAPARFSAQTLQRSSVVGTVLDTTGAPIPGATVTLGGVSVLGGARDVVTQSDGRYRFATLLPGTYSVTARAPGFQSTGQMDVELPVERTYTLDLTLEPSPVSEHVDVKSEAPLIDVTTAAVPALFASTLLQNLPTGRTLESVLNLAPGVTESVAFGGTQGSNGLSIDRVGLVEPYLGRPWVPVSYNWLDSVQVVALGASAEYGQSTGALANGIVRSGGNVFSGLGEYVAGVASWTGNNVKALGEQFRQAFAPRKVLSSWDANVQAGGPLRRDRLWVFAGVGTVRDRFRPFGYEGVEASARDEPRAVVKLDGMLAHGLRAQTLYQRDVSNTIGDELGAGTPTLATAGDRRRRNNLWNAQVFWAVGSNTELSGGSSGYSGHVSLDPHPPATLDGPPPQNDWVTGIVTGNILNYERDDRGAVTSALRIAHSGRFLRQSHELVAGFERESSRARSFYRPPGGRVDTLFDGVLQWTTLTSGSLTRTRNTRTTLFLQDRWRVHDRLTLEPGLRLERYLGAVPDRGIVFRTGLFGPRVGAAWDVTGDHHTVARAHYGRYYDMPFSYIYSFQDRAAISTRINMVEVTPGVFEELSRESDGVPAFSIDPHLRQSHVDQWVTGVERQLARDVAVETRYVHRRFGNFIGYVDKRLDDWTPYQVTDPGADGRAGTADDGGPLTGYVPYWWPDNTQWDLAISNPEGAFRRYDALQFLARKRESHGWEGQASYTWSHSVGTVAGTAGNNATLTNLSPYGFGGAPGGATSFRDQGTTRSRFDYSELKLFGWYHARWLSGATAGFVYRWHTGIRWHRTASVQSPLGDVDVIVAEPPFSRRTPSIAQLDVRLEKTFHLTSSVRRVGMYLDALNATNVGQALGYVPRSGPRFGQPSAWTDPRTIRLGVRYAF